MRISKFRVERYRSLKRGGVIELASKTVLVGPNNEGKSNILRALVVGLEALRAAAAGERPRSTSGVLRRNLHDFRSYNWERDFPIDEQASTPGASSVFEYELELNELDIAAFKEAIGHHINGALKLRVLVGARNRAQVKVVKRGPANAALNDKVGRIAEFVARRLQVEYVPADRTYERSHDLISKEARTALSRVQDSSEYIEALETIRRLERSALAPLEVQLQEGVTAFLPDVKAVRLNLPDSRRLMGGGVEVELDDGTLTALSSKGDGVQSLVAISLIAGLVPREPEISYVLALEEPEAHLHPGAVRELNRSLDGLASDAQVVLTTHSPVLVARHRPDANVLVRSNSVLPARSVSEIRASLGVELPDNLMSGEVMLLVEGGHDRAIIKSLIARRGGSPARALEDGRLRVRSMEGASNASYEYRLAVDSLHKVHVVFDDDSEGRRAARVLLDSGVNPRDISMLSVRPDGESEIEDLLLDELTTGVLQAEFHVRCDGSANSHLKFSRRAEQYFRKAGRPWGSSVEGNLKEAISREAVIATDVLSPSGVEIVDSICESLVLKLDSGKGLPSVRL